MRFKFVYNNRLGYNSDLIILNFSVDYRGDNITEDIINYLIIGKLLIYSIDIVVRFTYV
jgi:ABC-type enterochelin transport system permease subunit